VNKDVAAKTIALTFSGSLVLSSGSGPDSIQITDGVCKVTMIEF
jgi:hypothetical protein